jgi:hypothetical protein
VHTALIGDALANAVPTEDELAIFDLNRHVALFDAREIHFHDEGVLGFVEIELGIPFFHLCPQRRSPRTMNQLIKETIDFL